MEIKLEGGSSSNECPPAPPQEEAPADGSKEEEEEAEEAVSELSGLSDLSDDFKAESDVFAEERHRGLDPRLLLAEVLGPGADVPECASDLMLWRYLVHVLAQPPRRRKLPQHNTLDDVVRLLHDSRRIMVLTGAGVSVSCGIPDFRSRDGVYARLALDYPDLPDPQAMFDIAYFRQDPRPFFKFAKELFPGQFSPSPSHRFLRVLEQKGRLLRNYTQNIDTLEHAAGIRRLITCHGSFATATCTVCGHQVDSALIKEDIFNQCIPRCPACPGGEEGVMKPDIVFFGEGLPEAFHSALPRDKQDADLLIVIGSSLKVRPVAMIPGSLPPEVPQILINREPLRHLTFDVELLGDCDLILGEICRRLGWSHAGIPSTPLQEVESNNNECGLASMHINDADRFYFHPPNRYVFRGAELGEEEESPPSSPPQQEAPCEATVDPSKEDPPSQ